MSSQESPKWLIDQAVTQELDLEKRQYYIYNEFTDRSYLAQGYGSETNPIIFCDLPVGDSLSEVVELMKDLARRRNDDVFFAWEGEPHIITQAGRSLQLRLDERQRVIWDSQLNELVG